MFTWICPECGREVPPHFTECPDCAERKKGKATPAASEPAPQPAAAVAAPPPAVVPVPAPRSHLPAWLVTIVVAGVLIGVGALFFYVSPKHSDPAATPGRPQLETAGAPSTSPVAKFIEIAGFRIIEDAKQKARIRFVVINHSGADIADLSGTVILKPSTAKGEDPPLASFTFKLKSLEAYQTKDMNEEVKMKLRAYELPDWQFLRADTTITSP